MLSVPICVVHQGGDRLRGFRAVPDENPTITMLSVDGVGAYDHVYWSHAGWIVEDARSTRDSAFHPIVLRPTFLLRLARSGRQTADSDASGGRRVRGPVDALLLFHRDPERIGGGGSVSGSW